MDIKSCKDAIDWLVGYPVSLKMIRNIDNRKPVSAGHATDYIFKEQGVVSRFRAQYFKRLELDQRGIHRSQQNLVEEPRKTACRINAVRSIP